MPGVLGSVQAQGQPDADFPEMHSERIQSC
jgi:hypothetical protein